MNVIFSYVNKVTQPYATATSTLQVYENRVEVVVTRLDRGGNVYTYQYVWSIKNIERVIFMISPQDVKVDINNSPAITLPKTKDVIENLEKFVQIVKEML